MDPAAWHGVWPYLAVAAGAALEGEVIYSGAAVLVGLGRLDGPFVALAGTLGAAGGDQFYFYLLRGRLRWLLDRIGFIARRRPVIVEAVRRSETLIILAIRFSPGFRIALAAACAYAGVPAWRFSLLNAITVASGPSACWPSSPGWGRWCSRGSGSAAHGRPSSRPSCFSWSAGPSAEPRVRRWRGMGWKSPSVAQAFRPAARPRQG